MSKIIRLLLVLSMLVSLLLVSCFSAKKYVYRKIEDAKVLSGTYIDRKNVIQKAFHLYNDEFQLDSIEIYNIEILDNKLLNISVLREGDFVSIKQFKGKYLKKANCFEVKTESRFWPFIIVYAYVNDRVRLGFSEDGGLLVNVINQSFGWVIPLGVAGTDDSFKDNLNSADVGILIPFQSDDLLWGFKDLENQIVIDSQFEEIYSQDKYLSGGWVKLDGKWGMINHKGADILTAKYDSIIDAGKDTFITTLNGKEGLIINQQEVYCPVFDRIDTENFIIKSNPLPRLFLGELFYSVLSSPHFETVVDSVRYLVDFNRYMYKLSEVESSDGFTSTTIESPLYYTEIMLCN